jgi:hypothetical protein
MTVGKLYLEKPGRWQIYPGDDSGNISRACKKIAGQSCLCRVKTGGQGGW